RKPWRSTPSWMQRSRALTEAAFRSASSNEVVIIVFRFDREASLPRNEATLLPLSKLWPVVALIAPIFFPLPLRSQDSAISETQAQAQKIYATRCAVCH